MTIPAGGSVKSDSVSMNVFAQQDLAVSLYIPDANVHASAHSSAQVHSFMTANSAGDFSGDESKTAFTSGTTSMFWLKAIEVHSVSAGAVAALGDSITDGTCSTVDTHDRWEDWISTRLDADAGPAAKAMLNEGIGGNTVTTIRSNSAIERLDRDVLSHPCLTDVVVFSGINDINKGASASQVIAGLQDLVARIKAAGVRVVGATLIPRQDVSPAGSWTTTKTSIRNSVNSWIRTSGAFDAVVDFDHMVRDPVNVNNIRPEFNCDSVHPTPRGYFEIGRLFPLSVLQ